MKYFFVWLAFFAFLTILLPLGINMGNFRKSGETSRESPAPKTKVYFPQENKVVTMDTEEYIRGVVMAEMPAEFEFEALKAQAVAARTYMMQRISSDEHKSHPEGAEVCTDFTHCQAYISDADAKDKWGKNADLYFEKCKKAVEETAGVIATYQNEPIMAVFHSVSGGRTENASDVWGSEVSYLVSADSPGEEVAPKYKSKVEIDINDFKKLAKDNWNSDTSVSLISDIKRSDAGGVMTAKIGNKKVKGSQIRSVFNLNSTDFDVVTGDKSIVFNVVGYGHGVGMSQYGANYFAGLGWDYKKILKKYYTGIDFADMNKIPR